MRTECEDRMDHTQIHRNNEFKLVNDFLKKVFDHVSLKYCNKLSLTLSSNQFFAVVYFYED